MSRVRISDPSFGVSVLVLAGLTLLLVFAKVVLIPLALALTLSFLLVPAVQRLERRGIRRRIAVLVVSLTTAVCVSVAAYVLCRQVLDIAQTLPGYRVNIQTKIAALHSSSEQALERAVAMVEDVTGDLGLSRPSAQGDIVRVRVVGERSDQLRSLAQLVSSIVKPLGQTGIVIIFTIYILMNREDLRRRLLLLAGMGNINVMMQALEDATERISRYLVMQFQVNACYGVLFGTGLFFLHIPEATLWGVIAGTLRVIPYVGTLIGFALPLILSIAVSSSWWNPLAVFCLFFALETSAVYLVEPWLFSSRTGISSLALLSSAIFWSMLWGWPGLVLATPLTVCMVVLGSYIPQLSFLHSLLGTDVKLSPAAQLYERLLAMDQSEASVVAEGFLASSSLAELYDSVLIPVLSLAEEDRQKGALSDVRWNFLLLGVGDLVARLSEYQQPRSDEAVRSEVLSSAADAAQPPKEFAVVCVSAGDKADELATVMLAQLLEQAGYQILTLAAEVMSEEILRGLAAETNTVIVLSTLPLFAFARTRALCQRIRFHLPENRIVVGLWNSAEDTEETVARFGAARPELVANTLLQAMAQIDLWQKAGRRI